MYRHKACLIATFYTAARPCRDDGVGSIGPLPSALIAGMRWMRCHHSMHDQAATELSCPLRIASPSPFAPLVRLVVALAEVSKVPF